MSTMTREISNYDDIIDSRDVIARIEELDALTDAEITTDEVNELTILRALAEQGEDVEDWQHGATLIRDSYFEEYAEQLAEELDLIPADATWPATCIDWEQAARELRMDYTSVEFGGVTYWVR